VFFVWLGGGGVVVGNCVIFFFLVCYNLNMEKYDIHNPLAVSETVRVLEDGGVVMHPTETCYGLAVDVFNEEALRKLYTLKGRDFNKPVSILVSGLAMAVEYAEFSDLAFELAEKHWPGALSLVLPRKSKLPDFLNYSSSFVSLRFSSHEFIDEFMKSLKHPVTTTSANVSGDPSLYSLNFSSFGKSVDFIDIAIDGGVLPKNEPSTVVKIIGGELEMLRQGSVFL